MTRSFPLSVLILFVALIIAAPLQAQKQPSVEQLKSWITARQQCVDLLRDELKQSDARIESRLESIIETLTSYKDSQDTKSRVTRLKGETMKRLLNTIEFYTQKRTVFRQNLRNPQTVLKEDDKRMIIDTFDTRIEKRTQQILQLNKSISAEADKPEEAASTEKQGKDNDLSKRVASQNSVFNDAILKELEGSITRLERLGTALREQLAAIDDPEQKKERTAEIAKNDALIAERRNQKVAVSQPSDGAQRPISTDEASNLDVVLKRAFEDLQRDLTLFFERHTAFVTELTALRATEATLAARHTQ